MVCKNVAGDLGLGGGFSWSLWFTLLADRQVNFRLQQCQERYQFTFVYFCDLFLSIKSRKDAMPNS